MPPSRAASRLATCSSPIQQVSSAVSGLFVGFDHGPGPRFRVGHRLRRQHDQHAVDIRVATDGENRIAIALRRRVADDVDRIAVRPGGREAGIEFLDGFRARSARDVEVAGAVGSHGAGRRRW